MKSLLSIILIICLALPAIGQVKKNKSRKALRLEKEAREKEKIDRLISSRNFIFEATHALPMGGAGIFLNHDYDVKIKNDSVFSYLPFYGVAYRLDYGGRDAGFIFDLPIKEYFSEFKKKSHILKFEVDKTHDLITYHFNISELGYANLSITSTNRQSISFYGKITTPATEEEN